MWKSICIAIAVFHFLPEGSTQAQTITLQQCYEQARQNYPLIKQKSLISMSKEYSVDNVRSNHLPQLTINGQATYQSAVTKIPIELPNLSIPTLSKDQYRIYGEINQSLYDGGAVSRQSAMTEISSQVEDQGIEVELYKLKERINQLYFGVLLVDEQMAQVELLKKDLRTSLARVESAINNGTAFKSNASLLEAELLNADQRTIEMKSMRSAYLQMLGQFINQSLDENTSLERPQLMLEEDAEIKRPELNLFNYQSQLASAQYKLSQSRNLPRFGLFFQGGYGRPTLNLLNNNFSTYYIGGLRLSWSLGGLYNNKRDSQILDLNLQKINSQKETFLFNTNLALVQQQKEISKLKSLVEVDERIIALRTSIKNTAKVQQENGVITTNDYLRELNAEDKAIQNKLLHEMQLLMAAYNYQTTSGN